MAQMLLFPDPRPLVERLGRSFFLQAPQCPGVYLMRDAADTVLYVGKARNLRRRLASYRVANPDRLPRRHLRLLRAVTRIEFQACADEAEALAREAELLRRLRPRFNRAGTWPAPPRFLAWRITGQGLELTVAPALVAGWSCQGPLGTSVFLLRAALARLLWRAAHPSCGWAEMPEGWFHGAFPEPTLIAAPGWTPDALARVETLLKALFAREAGPFVEWIGRQSADRDHPFEAAARDADLEIIAQFATRPLPKPPLVSLPGSIPA